MKSYKYLRTVMAGLGPLTLAFTAQAQDLTNPCPNRIISWNVDNGVGTVTPTDLAGLAPAYNWNNALNPPMRDYVAPGLADNAGNATTADLLAHAANVSGIPWPTATDPGLDVNGTGNKRILNVYLNNGLAGWNPTDTNSYVSLTNMPYARYDVIVYCSSDASGRNATIDNGLGTTYNFKTIGTGFRTGGNCVFLPTTETNSGVFPVADFAFFHGMTAPNATFTETPKSGDSQWLGICAFQVIESSNVYVLYGPAPATQTVPVGQQASFSVMAGGLNPSYQWRHAGTNILDATNATYSIPTTTPGQDGDYDVVVANGFSSATSVVATLTFYAPQSLAWRGNGATWDTTSAFWTSSGGTATTYTETDIVLFGPAGSAQSSVSLSGPHTPSSIVVSNASYTFMSGSLAGAGSLRLMNNATFILDTIDGRTGPTVIDSGCTFQLDNADTAGSMGAGPLTNNGALVFYAAGDEAYGYPIYGAGNITNLGPSGRITLGGAVSGAYLVQAGGGELLLQGNNSISGGMIVSAGTVQVVAANALGGAPITVTGGELQLNWGYQYIGSSLTLSGGTLHGGIGGSQIFGGPVTLTTDSTITVDGGNNLTLLNTAGLAGSGHYFTKSGDGRLILAGTNNTFGTLYVGGGTVQIGAGGSIGGLTADSIQDDGALAFDLTTDLVITNQITGAGAINQIGSGTLTLDADLSAIGFSGQLTVSNGTLLVTGTSGYGAVFAAGGKLGGTGVLDASVSVQPGGTLAPGASIGTMTLNNVLEFAGGDMLVEVNKSLSQSNDLVVVPNGYGYVLAPGVVTVNNLGPALSAGDKFQVFSQPITSGDLLSVLGAGATWTNNIALDGTIAVLSVVPVTQPTITDVSFASPTDLVLAGTNGTPGMPFQVVSTTNVALPVAEWTLETSGLFGMDGSFSVTNTVTPGVPLKFYLLQQ